MVGRKFTDIFEEDRLPPVLSKLLQKHDNLTRQLESIPMLPKTREGTAKVNACKHSFSS